MKKILSIPGVGTTTCDQCMYGLETYTDDGKNAFAKTPTMFMSNSPILLKGLTLRCDGLHAHQHLTENRAKACENYPLDSCMPFSEVWHRPWTRDVP